MRFEAVPSSAVILLVVEKAQGAAHRFDDGDARKIVGTGERDGQSFRLSKKFNATGAPRRASDMPRVRKASAAEGTALSTACLMGYFVLSGPSESCQNPTPAPRQMRDLQRLFNHLVGDCERRRRHGEVRQLGALGVRRPCTVRPSDNLSFGRPILVREAHDEITEEAVGHQSERAEAHDPDEDLIGRHP